MSDKTIVGYKQATTEPCKGCEAPCCTRVPLYDFRPTRLVEIDYALYLCNFNRIEVALTDGPNIRVHYRMRCRNLNSEDRCDAHGTKRQPDVCKKYNPYTCTYKQTFLQNESSSLRLDQRRMAFVAEQIGFDENHNIVSFPTVAHLHNQLPEMGPINDSPPFDDEVYAQRQAWFRGEMAVEQPTYPLSRFNDTCIDCRAWCCTSLSFPIATPMSAAHFDYLDFLLNFPGLEIGVTSHQWTVIVRTTCRHSIREDNGAGRCSLYGQPERPQACILYDAQACGFKAQFKHPRPTHYIRLRRDDFEIITRELRFAENGYLQDLPSMEEMRSRIEASWL